MIRARGSELIVGLDVGTTKVCAVVGELEADGQVEIIGVGRSPSRGLRKGIVVNIESTVDSIRKAVRDAEGMAGVDIRNVHVGVAGGHIKGFNSRGVIAVKGDEITQADIDRVVEAAKAVAIPLDREILHVITKEYIVDGQGGVMDPRGMTGVRLEAEVHIITGSVSAVQNLVKCCEKADLQVSDIVLEPLASAETTLLDDERDLGVGVVDIGGGHTDIVLFHQGSVCHSAVLAIGGNHFTTDLAVGLRVPTAEGDRLKLEYGTALMSRVSDETMVRLRGQTGKHLREIPRRYLVEIIQPRAEELLQLVSEEIRRSSCQDLLTGGVVLTGGAAYLEGLPELGEEILEMPVRQGVPRGIPGFAENGLNLSHSTAVGLVLYAARNQMSQYDVRSVGEEGLLVGMVSRMKGWMHGVF